MKKLLLSLVGSGLIAGTAGAALYTDINVYGFTQINQSSPFSGEFDITGGPFGYKPSSEELYDASATFLFTDTDFKSESLTISLANSPVGTVSTFFGALVIKSSLGNSALSDLSSDGKLSFTINAISGNAYLTGATLSAKGGTQVPDGGATLTLVGLAFLSILCARRKLVSAC
jgi:hypothetical protein